ncbi:MAG TPA: Asp-tRNA(Asn)/Glu-tRNA(Gln) amidotransferase subunit GatC [Dehalococcoidia bacterium]|nr:Asp-tRNA(Asn)/Glu-tRNA(Gln) amidotransferase subunit GatC [Dehalococcoidia bacterium]
MPLTREEVEHVARLAHVGVTDEDVVRFRSQLSQILDYFEVLRAVDTEGVPPTSQSLPLENVTRPDETLQPLDQEAVLANAPLRSGGYFRVRKILE